MKPVFTKVRSALWSSEISKKERTRSFAECLFVSQNGQRLVNAALLNDE